MDKETLRDLFEASPDAIMVVDGEGALLQVNRQTEALLGYARDEIIGHPIELLIPERFHDQHIQYRERYLRGPTLRPMGVE